ncbi:plasmid partitioning/stability family protein [Enterobacter hormaechei subsp. steigerwaltii]|uniref:plasmid partitioning/stability family protein n=1 Tax=Enterobacter hormaechei TaxID=158836 RepID=UPI003F43E889
MNNTRKKITAYLHPDLYPQDALCYEYIQNRPTQTKGEFYRQSIICGAALSTIDSRLPGLLSSLYTKDVKAEDLVKIIEQVTGYKSQSVDLSTLESLLGSLTPGSVRNTSDAIDDSPQKQPPSKLSAFKR